MSTLNAEAFLLRARSALQMPTLYWLGFGGVAGAEERNSPPGTPINATAELQRLQRKDPVKHAKYSGGLQQLGLSMADLPTLACDCTGYVAWALGMARHPVTLAGKDDAWFYTNDIHADARGPQQSFRRLQAPKVGAMLVYPGAEAVGKVGHIGIITEVQDGRATRMLHCAPENFFLTPTEGMPRNAIAETPCERMDAEAGTLIVAWKRFG
jgi:CHAP domain